MFAPGNVLRLALASCMPLSLCLAQGQDTDPFAESNNLRPKPAVQAPRPEYPVKLTLISEKRNGEAPQRIVVTLAIEKGYQLYANPPGNEQIGYVTTLTIKGKGKPELVSVTYPKGQLVKDGIIGDYQVYKSTVTLEALIKRGKDDQDGVDIAVRVFPTDNRGCLWPIRRLTERVP